MRLLARTARGAGPSWLWRHRTGTPPHSAAGFEMATVAALGCALWSSRSGSSTLPWRPPGRPRRRPPAAIAAAGAAAGGQPWSGSRSAISASGVQSPSPGSACSSRRTSTARACAPVKAATGAVTRRTASCRRLRPGPAGAARRRPTLSYGPVGRSPTWGPARGRRTPPRPRSARGGPARHHHTPPAALCTAAPASVLSRAPPRWGRPAASLLEALARSGARVSGRGTRRSPRGRPRR